MVLRIKGYRSLAQQTHQTMDSNVERFPGTQPGPLYYYGFSAKSQSSGLDEQDPDAYRRYLSLSGAC